jgi:hypothetical protein
MAGMEYRPTSTCTGDGNKEDNAMKRLLITALAISGLVQLLHAQTGVGAKYGARDPVTCKSRKEPAKGAPTPEQVKLYMMCESEGVSFGYFLLFGNVQVEIGKARPFNAITDSLKSDADADSPVYPIRGSYDRYTCSLLDPPRTVYGRNCMVQGQPQATGSCYRNTFGDWSCGMIDASNPSSARRDNVAPPR